DFDLGSWSRMMVCVVARALEPVWLPGDCRVLRFVFFLVVVPIFLPVVGRRNVTPMGPPGQCLGLDLIGVPIPGTYTLDHRIHLMCLFISRFICHRILISIFLARGLTML